MFAPNKNMPALDRSIRHEVTKAIQKVSAPKHIEILRDMEALRNAVPDSELVAIRRTLMKLHETYTDAYAKHREIDRYVVDNQEVSLHGEARQAALAELDERVDNDMKTLAPIRRLQKDGTMMAKALSPCRSYWRMDNDDSGDILIYVSTPKREHGYPSSSDNSEKLKAPHHAFLASATAQNLQAEERLASDERCRQESSSIRETDHECDRTDKPNLHLALSGQKRKASSDCINEGIEDAGQQPMKVARVEESGRVCPILVLRTKQIKAKTDTQNINSWQAVLKTLSSLKVAPFEKIQKIMQERTPIIHEVGGHYVFGCCHACKEFRFTSSPNSAEVMNHVKKCYPGEEVSLAWILQKCCRRGRLSVFASTFPRFPLIEESCQFHLDTSCQNITYKWKMLERAPIQKQRVVWKPQQP